MSTALIARVDHLEIARHYARNAHLWSVQPQFDAANRWQACLADDPDAQIWLLTWLPGQSTALHDHGGSTGAFVVVSGALSEETVTTSRYGTQTRTDVVGAGHGRRFGANYIHRMSNTFRSPAVSVHVYGSAFESMNRYELTGERLRRVGIDRAGLLG